MLFAGGIVRKTLLGELIALRYVLTLINFLFLISVATTLSSPLDGAVAIQ